MTYNQYNLIRHKMEEKEKGKKNYLENFPMSVSLFFRISKKICLECFYISRKITIILKNNGHGHQLTKLL